MSADSPTKVINPGCERNQIDELTARLADEMVLRWQKGDGPTAEELLARHPELKSEPEASIRLIYEEVCIRRAAGEIVSFKEIAGRFPQWRTRLAALLDCPRPMKMLPPPEIPAVDEALGEFILLAELGRGVQGRVYLASQPALAERLVVLKITPRTGQEHLTLARLQHTHIMPLYAVHDDPKRNLRTLCMPYFAGAALHQVLDELHTVPFAERTGRHLLQALERAEARATEVTGGGAAGTELPRRLFVGVSYVQAICWIGACLADALQYAHERGLVHLDLKPSNVLLAADGQPMLLDFHIAQKPLLPDGPVPEGMGGTPAYMSPEQNAALIAVREGKQITTAVDGRTDIYALGLMLYEALGGVVPLKDRAAVPSLCRWNPQVSAGLDDILRKCLAYDPQQRYATPAALAVDLRRHLRNLPLQGVRNRSLRERWRKWRRRHPHALGFLFMAVAVLTAAFAVGLMDLNRVGQERLDAETALAKGEQALQNHAHAQAVDSLVRARTLAERLPGNDELTAKIDRELDHARHALAAEQLHTLADRLRFLVGDSTLPNGETTALTRRWRAVWDKRGWLKERGSNLLEPALEKQLDADLLDLGMIWADLCVRLAEPAKKNEARIEALHILDDTEMLFGPRYVLSRQRQLYAQALGRTAEAEAAGQEAARLAPRSAWEFYALGRTHLQQGELTQAAAALEKAIALKPQEFWPNFYAGVCAYRRERFEEAVSDFRVCIALKPEIAACYYNRGLAQAALGRKDEAAHDYERAVRLDPHFATVRKH